MIPSLDSVPNHHWMVTVPCLSHGAPHWFTAQSGVTRGTPIQPPGKAEWCCLSLLPHHTRAVLHSVRKWGERLCPQPSVVTQIGATRAPHLRVLESCPCSLCLRLHRTQPVALISLGWEETSAILSLHSALPQAFTHHLHASFFFPRQVHTCKSPPGYRPPSEFMRRVQMPHLRWAGPSAAWLLWTVLSLVFQKASNGGWDRVTPRASLRSSLVK